jgi:hypothetical protein
MDVMDLSSALLVRCKKKKEYLYLKTLQLSHVGILSTRLPQRNLMQTSRILFVAKEFLRFALCLFRTHIGICLYVTTVEGTHKVHKKVCT